MHVVPVRTLTKEKTMISRSRLTVLALLAFVLQPLAVAAETPETEAVKAAEA